MAKAEETGIMALPEADGAPAEKPAMSMQEMYDSQQQGLQEGNPEGHAIYQEMQDTLVPALMEIPVEMLAAMLDVLQAINDDPSTYKSSLAELSKAGLDTSEFPEEYDSDFIATLASVFMEALRRKSRDSQRDMQGGIGAIVPQKFAKGGIAEAVQLVASQGRRGDTTLAHINKSEAALLKRLGGSGTINPKTGLHEYGWNPVKAVTNFVSGAAKSVTNAISGAVKSVVGAVKKIVASPVGRILATVALAAFLGPGAFGVTGLGWSAGAALGTAMATTTYLATGSLKQAVVAGAAGYFGAPGGEVSTAVAASAPTIAATGSVANAAITAGVVGTGAGLVSGSSLKDSVKQGLTGAAVAGTLAYMSPAQAQADATKSGTKEFSQQDLAKMGENTSPQLAPQGNGVQVDTTQKPFSVDDLSSMSEGAAGTGAQVAGRVTPIDPSQPFNPQTDMAGMSEGAGRNVAAGNQGTTINNQGQTVSRGTQVANNVTADNPYGVPGPKEPAWGVGKSAGLAGEGVSDMATGNFSQGWDKFSTGVGELFSPSGTAGMLRTYGPGMLAGYALLQGSGATEPTQPELTPTEKAMQEKTLEEYADVKNNPQKYALQNQEGTQYDTAGKPTGVGGAYDYPTAKATSVDPRSVLNLPAATNATYTPPAYALSNSNGRPIAQPYNNADAYTNLLPWYLRQQQPMRAASGGIADVAPSYMAATELASGGYPRKTGAINGPGTATSDSIPAMLSDGEFVMTAKAVKSMGGGSRREGAKKMYALMHQLERNASRG